MEKPLSRRGTISVVHLKTLRGDSESLIEDDLTPSYSDLLFRVDLRDGTPGFVYVLLEHLSEPPPRGLTALRLLGYMVTLWKRHTDHSRSEYLPLVIPLVLSHHPRGWRGPTTFQHLFAPTVLAVPGFREFLPAFRFALDDLSHQSNEQLKARAVAPFLQLFFWALRDGRRSSLILTGLGAWADALTNTANAENGVDAIRSLFDYIAEAGRMDAEQRKKLRERLAQHSPSAENALMNFSEHARAEGREEGQVLGQRATLIKLLQLKFGVLPAEIAARLENASPEELDRWTEAVLSASSLEAVFG
jgi:hypothetical protein